MNTDDREKLSALTDQVTELTGAVARIERGIFGDQEMKVPGIAQDLDTVKKLVDAHDRKLLVWGSTVVVITAALYKVLPIILG